MKENARNVMDNIILGKMNREETIRALYNAVTDNILPDDGSEDKQYYFDEGTGSWYLLTGRQQIDRPNIELAKKYFEDILRPIARVDAKNPQYKKALYCAIAIESINRMLEHNNH